MTCIASSRPRTACHTLDAVNSLRLLLPALAFALLGAHFYRAASWPALLACAAGLALLAWPRRWAVRVAQTLLVLGAAEWAWTAVLLVQQRQALGQPWVRLACILAAVALFTLASAFVLRRRHVRSSEVPG